MRCTAIHTYGTHKVRGSGLVKGLEHLVVLDDRVNIHIGAKCESHSRKSEKIGRNLGKLICVCNTIPSLRIDFQAISAWIVKLGMLTEHHLEVDSGIFMKQVQCCFSLA